MLFSHEKGMGLHPAVYGLAGLPRFARFDQWHWALLTVSLEPLADEY
jgi:hypothetical protein